MGRKGEEEGEGRGGEGAKWTEATSKNQKTCRMRWGGVKYGLNL